METLPACLKLSGHNNVATWCTLCIYSDGKYHSKGDGLCHCMGTSAVTPATVSKSCIAFTRMTVYIPCPSCSYNRICRLMSAVAKGRCGGSRTERLSLNTVANGRSAESCGG